MLIRNRFINFVANKYPVCQRYYRLFHTFSEMEPATPATSAQTKHQLTAQQQQQLRDLLSVQEQRLKTTLERVKQYCHREFQSRKQTYISLIKTFNSSKAPITPELLNTATLPFSDKVRHIREKLNTVVDFKQVIMNSQNELNKKCDLNAEEQVQAQINFDLVCNYAKRREDNISGKGLYTLPVCKHLIRKTFKKTAVAVYDVLSSYKTDWIEQDKKVIKVASIGGGPASDMTGTLAYLMSEGYEEFYCRVFDFNAQRWKQAASGLNQLIVKEGKRVSKNVKLDLDWQSFDMDPNCQNHKALADIADFDLVTCCWALNQDVYSESMWKTIINSNKKSLILAIDGDRFPIQYLSQLAHTCGRKAHYCPYLSPRILVILPQK